MPTLSERTNDPAGEARFRRGYAHGAQAVIDALGPYLDERRLWKLRTWASNQLGDWQTGKTEGSEAPAIPDLNGQLPNQGAVTAAEIVPGLVVHLDAAILRKHGGCLSNVERTTTTGPVIGPHYFLILEELESSLYLSVPLFSSNTLGGVQLYPNQKTGPSRDWSNPGDDTWFSKFQHWKIPESAIIAASGNDDGSVGVRRHYAQTQPRVRDYIIQSQTQNRKKTFDPI